jgi:hypothetical protein
MHMDRLIFELKVSVEATSLYILMCAFLDQGEAPTLEHAKGRWSGDEGSLVKAASELMERGVLERALPVPMDRPLNVLPSDQWLWPTPQIL